MAVTTGEPTRSACSTPPNACRRAGCRRRVAPGHQRRGRQQRGRRPLPLRFQGGTGAPRPRPADGDAGRGAGRRWRRWSTSPLRRHVRSGRGSCARSSASPPIPPVPLRALPRRALRAGGTGPGTRRPRSRLSGPGSVPCSRRDAGLDDESAACALSLASETMLRMLADADRYAGSLDPSTTSPT